VKSGDLTPSIVDLPPFHFYERRAGAGTPVVLIHGLGGSSDWWRRNVETIAQEHLVATVDLVQRARLPPGISETATVLARWIETSFIEPVHLVGNSMGGHLAIHVSAQRPDLVRSLTLVNSSGIPFEIAPGAHVANLIVPRGALSFGRILARDALRSSPASVALAFARLLRDDARELMRGLRMPVLVLWGERDPLVPLKYGQEIARTIPNARLVPIPDAGHVPMWENADAFNRALVEFLRDNDQQPPTSTQHPVFTWSITGWTNGVAHRQSSRSPNMVLVHGLGLSSAYFQRFARALHARGWFAIAPDLPGFGYSADAPASGPEGHARVLAQWAEAVGIRGAVWVGHSIACNAVAHVARTRPDLCRAAIMIGPLWTHSARPMLRLVPLLALDAMREPLALYGDVLAAYWRCGLARWFGTLRRYAPDFRADPPEAQMIAGLRDPLPDRTRVRVVEIQGAHACHYSHPGATVLAIAEEPPGTGTAAR
jgi:pimeloyl-ACP methyl ester carboxylesterase